MAKIDKKFLSPISGGIYYMVLRAQKKNCVETRQKARERNWVLSNVKDTSLVGPLKPGPAEVRQDSFIRFQDNIMEQASEYAPL